MHSSRGVEARAARHLAHVAACQAELAPLARDVPEGQATEPRSERPGRVKRRARV